MAHARVRGNSRCRKCAEEIAHFRNRQQNRAGQQRRAMYIYMQRWRGSWESRVDPGLVSAQCIDLIRPGVGEAEPADTWPGCSRARVGNTAVFCPRRVFKKLADSAESEVHTDEADE